MGNTDTSTHILVATKLGQVINLSLCLVDIQRIVTIDEGDTCRVISSIFKSAKTFDKDRISFFLSYISYYSTHIS